MHLRVLTNKLPQPMRFGLRKLAFQGSAHQCVLCDNSIREFHAHGGGAAVLELRQVVGGMKRTDDRCPVCHGVDRTRLMMTYLQQETRVGKTPLRLLHVAPDPGLYVWLKRQKNLDYVCSDLDGKRYRHIVDLKTADLTDMPFESDSFDVIVCSHVLEHVPDDRAAFSELFRILKPGGKALLITPYALDGKGTDEDLSIDDPALKDARFGQWDHVRIYDRSDFVSRMENAGFKTSLYDPFKIDPRRANALHLNPLEVLPIGEKPA